MSVAYADRPVALIVEDRPHALRKRKELFDLSGFMSLQASSKEEALLQLECAPAIDIVITDIDLNPKNSGDRSGIDLASEVKHRRPAMPIVGYSGLISENELAPHEWRRFDRHMPKGRSGVKAMESRIDELRDLALAYRRQRLATAVEELERIKRKYRLHDKDYSVLRDFLAGSHLPSGGVHKVTSAASAEEILGDLGYRLRSIGPEWATENDAGEAVPRMKSSVIVWIREENGVVVAELYGHPTLYESGNSEKEAIGRLHVLMGGFYSDFCLDPTTPLSAELLRLKDYLRHVFG